MTVTFNELDMGFEHSTMVRPVTRNISPQVLRPLVQAIREKKRVDICYTSLKDGEQSERIISPHTLVLHTITLAFALIVNRLVAIVILS